MFNNGKFKNVVADSENISPSVDRTVPPGGTLNTTVALRPQRGPTKNWIALEDTLQRSTEPDEITGAIAASAIRSPNFVMQAAQLLSGHPLASPAMAMPQPPNSAALSAATASSSGGNGLGDDRNVFAIYVSYYVKVKLTLSGMGGELSLKLPFVLVHVDESMRPGHTSSTLAELRLERLTLQDVPVGRKNGKRLSTMDKSSNTSPLPFGDGPSTSAAAAAAAAVNVGVDDISQLDCIEPADEEFNICVPVPTGPPKQSSSIQKRRLQRSETLARDIDDTEEPQVEPQQVEQHVVQVHLEQHREEERQQPTTETGTIPKTTNV